MLSSLLIQADILSNFENQFFMKILLLTPNGQLPPQILTNFGGEYSFFEKIKMGGVGSPRMILQAEESQLDELQLIDNQFIYSNIEILKKGFVLRVWQNRAFRAIVFGKSEIREMTFEKYPMLTAKPNIFAGEVHIQCTDISLHLFIPPNLFKKTITFFQKSTFDFLKIYESEARKPQELLTTDANILSFLKD